LIIVSPTHHQIQVNIVYTERLQRTVDALLDALMPWVIKFGSDPDLLAGNARVLDTLTNLLFVAVGKSGVDMPVTALEGCLDSFADLTRL
jgi:hypothetical protein